MKTINVKNILAGLLLTTLLVCGCKKDPVAPPVIVPQATDVNKFIFNGLRDYYLWNVEVPALANEKYQNTDSLNRFLNKYTDPQVLFTSLLYRYQQIDKWSFLVDNSKTIDDFISGTSKTMGFDFMLWKIGTTSNVFGFVRYVFSGSPAEKAGLKRGDIFLTINDTQLSVANYQTLLFKTDTYKMGFATITNNTIVPSLKTLSMTAIEMQENPINKDTIFTFNNQKIGYLVYNGFNSDFDIQLNNVIKGFKDANIDQLVLDLRYNGGGSVQSSIYLASMIYGTDKTKIFAQSQYNTGLEAYFTQKGGLSSMNDYFAQTIDATTTTPATPINTLNMKKVYIIATDNTASASELLINGLRPYLNVVLVGSNTDGKYVGSMTIKDWDAQGNVNPKDPYAMQPIVVKYSNSNGATDFVNGLTPDIKVEEDIANLLPFGDPNEKMLNAVLADIQGAPVTSMTLKSAPIGLKKVADSHDFKPFAHDMYINPIRKHQE